ncbi:hypothetical protein V8F33_009576 [Rhypophila sp. PSN 637]
MPRLRVRCKCDTHKWVGHLSMKNKYSSQCSVAGYDESNGCGEQTPHTPNRAATLDPPKNQPEVPTTSPIPMKSDFSAMPGTFPGAGSHTFNPASPGNPFVRRQSGHPTRQCSYCGRGGGKELHAMDLTPMDWLYLIGALAVAVILLVVTVLNLQALLGPKGEQPPH